MKTLTRIATTTITLLHLSLRVLTHAAVAAPTSTVSASSKAGLGWGASGNVDISQYTTTGKVSWFYDWSPQPWITTNLEFVPMLWGGKSISEFTSTINNTISSGKVAAVLGMNEPDQSSQSNLSPQSGAQMWETYLQPLKSQGLLLGSPATASEPAGIIWVQEFLSNCSSCDVDFIALHWYGTNATQFIDYLENFHNTLQKPLWVTEWACQNMVDANEQCSQSDINSFMSQTQAFMDGTDWVERYAWFGAMENMNGVNPDDALMTTNGEINALGEQYIGSSANGSTPVGASAMSLHATASPVVLSLFAAATLAFILL